MKNLFLTAALVFVGATTFAQTAFEKAMTELGRRPDKLPKN